MSQPRCTCLDIPDYSIICVLCGCTKDNHSNCLGNFVCTHCNGDVPSNPKCMVPVVSQFAVPVVSPFAIKFAVPANMVGDTAAPMECMCQEHNNYNGCILCKS